MTYTTIVSTTELAAHLNDPDWIILDCQHDLMQPEYGHQAYAAGHIPGAQFIALDDDLAGAKTGSNGRHPLPTVEALTAVFSRLGVTASKQVVIYDGVQGMYAGRAWWTLKWLGHDAVALLDGSLTKWKAEGRPLSTEIPHAQPAHFVPRANDSLRVDAAYVSMHLNDRAIIDARAPDRYDGSAETIDPVGGHIPGAKNRFFKDNLLANGHFKSATELQAEFSALIPSAAASIMQCGSGVSACHNLLALEVAGMPGAKLYPGSWSEWCANPARPVAKGSKP